MPSFSFSSSIRVASQDHILRLKITHNLVHGSPSEDVHNVKGRLPKELDVLWLSDLTISLSGLADGHQVSAHEIARSALVQHLQTHLKTNADRLGLNNVSRSFVDDADGLPKLMLTPSRPLPRASRPHANLVSLHLAYIWRTISGGCDATATATSRLAEEVNPFALTLFLPTEALLNRATEQFLIYHLVGRYPLIFGSWCKRLDLEIQYFPSIGHSIVEIITRSQNRRFLSKCGRLLKIARRHHKFVLQTCTTALSSCTDDAAPDSSEKEIGNSHATPALTDEQILCESMEQLFRVGVPQRRLKPATTPQRVSLPQDDDDILLPWIPDAGNDDGASWIELPEITTALVADSYQTLLEGMDVFTEEDWPEDEMRLHGADTTTDEREFDVHSDESLISASFPLATIATPPSHAFSSTLYHRLDVDRQGPDPAAANGLCCRASQVAFLENSGSSETFANLTHPPSHGPHDQHYSEKYAQLTQGWGAWQTGSESFETLDGSSGCEEVENWDSMFLCLDEDVDAPTQSPSAADAVDLEWDDPL